MVNKIEKFFRKRAVNEQPAQKDAPNVTCSSESRLMCRPREGLKARRASMADAEYTFAKSFAMSPQLFPSASI